MNSTKLYIALPCMNEFPEIINTINCVLGQTYDNFVLLVCVNQPINYYHNKEKQSIIENNKQTIEYLKSLRDNRIIVIDKTSYDNALPENKSGAGWARKILFDEILTLSKNNTDIIVSLDADCIFEKNYFESIVELFNQFPLAVGLSNPFYHKLTDDAELNRVMLRYEIYMRYFQCNLWRISSPYCFTALGSAIAFPVWAYKKIKSVAARESGEDFYLLQKLRKNGRLILYNKVIVYPATRYSDRVAFGTGPALIKGREWNWKSYPIYHYELFNRIQKFYTQIEELHKKNINTNVDDFLKKYLKIEPFELWAILRKHNPNIVRFIHAVHTKFDGLRILQFLHFHNNQDCDEEKIIISYLKNFHQIDFDEFSFKSSNIDVLDNVRNKFFEIETQYRYNDYKLNIELLKDKNRWKYLN